MFRVAQRLRAAAGLLLVFAAAGGAQAAANAGSCEPAPAKAVSVQGNVDVRRAGATGWQALSLNDPLCAGDEVRVGDQSRADVAVLNQSLVRLNANSAITIEAPREHLTGVVSLMQGVAHFLSRGPRSLQVQTPFTIAGVRGTEFLITVDPARTLVTVFEGTVVAENSQGNLTLTDGQSALARQGTAPAPTVVVRPRDAVQWALYYPPVIYVASDEFKADAGWEGMVRRSGDAYRRGDLKQAFDSIRNVPADVRDPRLFTYRAQLSLAAGRVDDARTDIDRALKLAPSNVDALALQSIIALVQDDKDKAFATAQQAVAAAPNSATARIALSYAQQARFDLAGAAASLERSVAIDPHNALAWARLAEIRSSLGESGPALVAAGKAVDLDPNLSRTQTVLGFANLTRVDTAQARAAFEKAITLDQADPLPRLGLGLAKIRDGKLDEGSRDIEIAASLDPNNAMVHSYLGKAYFEEKRSPRDEREFGVAKGLDPKDPTPYFYDAIAKQTTNRPVEALHDLDRAIALNDNRAIYRSKLLLDSDLAARSASLARIYSDLGFQDLALVEGWKSVNTDPGNFSAHRFLADSYAALPRHEIARVSELLQSQLLQPLSMTPIQPHLAESNLFLLSAGGPGSLSFNEFNPLFNRNGVALQASALVGGNETRAEEGVVAGIQGNMAFSVGGFHFQSGGWRANSDQKDDIANAFFQMELAPETSIQAEYRYRKAETGDLQLRFFPDEFFPGQRTPLMTNTYRIGARHNFSPDSVTLASVIYSEAQFGAFDTQPFVAPGFITFLGLKEPQKATGVELQHQFRSGIFNFVGGVGYFKRDSTATVTINTVLPPPDDVSQFPPQDTGVKHTNVYAYTYLRYPKNVTLTVGASGDVTQGESPDIKGIHQFNPKLGLTWEPVSGTTVRAAAFRVLKRTLITDQTLEPTQVAGFNQFFDDFNGTKAWRYGGAIDQKFSPDVYGGVEVSKRNLNVPATDQFGDAIRVDWEEGLSRAYLFWTPHPWIALRSEFNYERVRRDLNLTDGVQRLDTYRVPLGINFFHPSGFSATVGTTYYNQKGDFESIQTAGDIQPGHDRFWTVDAGISYRLPQRRGSVALGATNLFNRKFMYFDTDFKNPSIQPDRIVRVQVTLALP